MKLSASHPVEAAPAAVFDRLRDVDALLADLGLRSADLVRLDAPAPAGIGSVWRGHVSLGGIDRPLEARLVEMTPPESLRLAAEAGGIGLDALIRLAALPDQRTDLSVAAELRPLSLTGRVAVQSLRLIQDSIAKRLQDRVRHLARHLQQTA